MMRRLMDRASSSDDALTSRAAALLAAMPPLDTSRLTPRSLPGPAGKRAPGTAIRTGLVIAFTLSTVAAAAATLRVWPLITSRAALPAVGVAAFPSPPAEREPGLLASPVASALKAPTDPAERFVVSKTESAAPPPALPTAPIVPATVAPMTAVPVTVVLAAAVAKGVRAPSKSAVPTGSQPDVTPVEDESTLILRAVRALRRDGDPARAEELAQQALSRFPQGAQVEEATALAMEAASAKGDVVDARRAAQAYLDRFRSGRFVDRAQRIMLTLPGR
jgi:hypothetical protein